MKKMNSMPSYYKNTVVGILFNLTFNTMGSELDEPSFRMAGGNKIMGIVGKRGVGSPRLRCTARLKYGKVMWINV
jgi:hypothetical protein